MKWIGSILLALICTTSTLAIDLTKAEREWIKKNPDVRLGVDTAFPPYEWFDEQAGYSGLSLDYIKQIELLTGLSITPVRGLTWAQIMAGMKEGSVDIIPTLLQTPERKKFIDFTVPFQNAIAVLMVRKGEALDGGLSSYNKRKVGTIEGYYAHEMIGNEYPNTDLHLYRTAKKGLKDLAIGNIDVFVGNLAVLNFIAQANTLNNLEVAESFASEQEFSMGVRKGLPILTAIISKALQAIPESERVRIAIKWGQYKSNSIDLTSEERIWIEQNPIVKLGYDPNWPPFEWHDKEEGYIGLTADYMKQVASVTGLKFEAVEGLFWPEVLAGLKDGSLHVAASIVPSAQKDKYLNYTRAYASYPEAIMTRKNEGKFTGIASFTGRKVGVGDEYSLHEFLVNNHPELDIVPFKSPEEGLIALSLGKIDAYVGTFAVLNYFLDKNGLSNLQFAGRVENASETALSVGVRKDSPLLVSIIDKALAAIPEATRLKISHRWVQYSEGSTTELTVEEQEWIATHPVIRSHVSNTPPNHFWDNGAKGVSVDVLNRIGKMFGFKMDFVYGMAWPEALDAMRNHKRVDILPATQRTPEREKYMLFSQNYLNTPVAIFMRDDVSPISGLQGLFGKTIAIPKGYALQVELARDYPQIKQLHVGYPDDALRAVSEGDADAYIGDITTGQYHIIHKGFNNVNVVAESGLDTHQLGFAVRDDWVILVSILNKGLAKISSEEFASIHYQYYTVDAPEPLIEYMLLFWIVVVSSILIVMVLIWNRTLQRKVADSTAQLKSYSNHLEEEVAIRTNELKASSDLSKLSLELSKSGSWHMDYLDFPDRFYATKELLEIQGEVLPDDVDYVMAEDWVSNIISTNEEAGKHAAELFACALKDPAITYDATWQYTRKKDGQVIWMRACADITRDNAGNVISVQGVSQDITAQKEYAVAIRKSETSLAEAQQLAHLGSSEWNLITDEVIWSDEALDIFGIAKKEGSFTIDDFMARVHPEDIDYIKNVIAKVIETRKPQNVEHRVIRPNGDIRTLFQRGKVGLNKEGEPIRIYTTIQDISKQKVAEAELLRVNALSNTALELSNSSFWWIDYKTPDLYHASAKNVELQGFAPAENNVYHIVDDWYACVAAADKALAEKAYRNYLDATLGKGTFDVIYPFKRPANGQIIWKRTVGEIVKDAEGNNQFMYGVSQDVTEQQRVSQKLNEAKESAEKANRAKSDFLANMSHEIRTPMNAIIGLSHLALKMELEPKLHDYIEKISDSSNSLLGIINDILDFSKIEAGMIVLENVPFDLTKTIRQMLGIFAQSAQSKGLHLKVDLHPDVPRQLKGDPLRLRQIMINLIGNAVKFTEQGFVCIAVNVKNRDTDRIELEFSITDTGIGMSQLQSETIFDAFNQADTSTTRRFGGTGLGLSITQRLVELMGGEITIESELGEGSTFSFTSIFEESQEILASVEVTTPIGLPELSAMRILLVEDNKINQDVALGLLEGTGCEMLLANNGQEALDLIEANEIDIVLMDVQMPVMDGLEATRQIRKREKEGEHLPVIAMTANAMQGDREVVVDAGMDGYVAKPVVPEKLYRELSNWKHKIGF